MPNYYASSPYPHEVAWPKTAYHATKDSKQVNSPAEFEALGPEWSLNYADKKRDYPKHKYDKDGNSQTVADPEDERAHPDWTDKKPEPKAAEAKHENHVAQKK